MLYDLRKPLDKSRFERRAAQLAKSGEVTVELTERKNRTLAQNAYLHLILGFFAMETGYTRDFVKQEYFKRLVNPELFIEERDGKLGKAEVLRSSRELTTGEMTTAIERFRNWSSQEAGIYIPSPNEEEFLREVEIELNKVNYFI